MALDERLDRKLILFDGPVDTSWIESMNSLMDDNKLLTLANGERISMTAQVTLLFETEDLSAASPATVSRAGIIYCDYGKLGWQPYFDSWLKQTSSQVKTTLAWHRSCTESTFRMFARSFVSVPASISNPYCTTNACIATN